MDTEYLSQAPFQCKLDWGSRGAELAAARGEIVVLVDTLSFSTTVINAVDRGGIIYPCGDGDDPVEVALKIGGEPSVHRKQVPAQGRFSLSPSSFDCIEAGTKVALWSPNGANCSRSASPAPFVFLGAFVNAAILAEVVSATMEAEKLAVTVIACGERVPLEDNRFGEMRMAIEDYLAAGSILSKLSENRSPEAAVCVSAFKSNKSRIEELIWESVSGREARLGGFENDVRFAVRLNVIDAVPILRQGAFVKYAPSS
jgi:2-phosphosulfolactate phosphatase